jgi:osomolarity two-component system sensor histidine kinase NIK1
LTELLTTQDSAGEMLDLKLTVNGMVRPLTPLSLSRRCLVAESRPPRQVSQLRVFTAEVTKVAIAVGTEGRLGGQAVVPDAKGEWKDLLDNVNLMAGVCICSAQMLQERPLIVDTA